MSRGASGDVYAPLKKKKKRAKFWSSACGGLGLVAHVQPRRLALGGMRPCPSFSERRALMPAVLHKFPDHSVFVSWNRDNHCKEEGGGGCVHSKVL